MTILISSDHGGFALKERIELHYDVANDMPDADKVKIEDLGPHELNLDDDYPLFAFKLAEELVKRLNDSQVREDRDLPLLGILICRSGNGMAIAANKVKGARAALCFTPEHARKARAHDHANILVLDADYVEEEVHMQIVDTFIHSAPEMGGRHERRVEQINNYGIKQ